MGIDRRSRGKGRSRGGRGKNRREREGVTATEEGVEAGEWKRIKAGEEGIEAGGGGAKSPSSRRGRSRRRGGREIQA